MGITNLPGGVKIQSGSDSIASGQTIEDVTITAVDTSRSIVVLSSHVTNAAQVDDLRTALASGSLTSATNLRLERGSTVGTAVCKWFVIEWR